MLLKNVLIPPHGLAPNHENVLGVLSLIFWSLIIVVTIKYHIFIIKFDNEGEGGILALMELVRPKNKKGAFTFIIVTIGLFGASLLYGDGIITPAISVLSAVEGLNVATPYFEPFIIPLTLIILFILFYFQKRGTSGIGVIFGPVTLIWFLSIAALGIGAIINNPEVLYAVNPQYALEFFIQ
jgi:KUP system potassium uptake protein